MSRAAGSEYRRLISPLLEDSGGLDRLVRYAEMIERWSTVHNLIRFDGREELVQRHLAEALAALPRMEGRGLLIDVGSGAGIPGVPLLIARPGWRGELLEPRHKRWAFLRAVVRELGLDAEVVATRYQDHRPAGAMDVVTVRGLAGVEEVLRWAAGVLTPSGRVLVWGTQEREEALRKEAGWRVLSCPLAHLERGRLIECRPCFT